MKDIFRHQTALVESEDIGPGTSIWAYSHIMAGARVGRNCNIGDHCFVEGGASIGDNVTMKNGNMIWEGVTIEDDVFVGPHVFFTNDRYPRSHRGAAGGARHAAKKGWLLPTIVQRGASLGAGAVLCPGIAVGRYAMVAAGAVVTRDVPPFSLVKGNPARPSGWVCFCGHPLHFEHHQAVCADCGRQFQQDYDSICPTSELDHHAAVRQD